MVYGIADKLWLQVRLRNLMDTIIWLRHSMRKYQRRSDNLGKHQPIPQILA
jgi:hypothetical protein